MNKESKIFVSEEYSTSKRVIFKLIRNGTFFNLTGADAVAFDFKKNGSFRLDFKGRGTIFGTFEEIIPDTRISLNWNVNGFGRDEEVNTKVVISIFKLDDGTVVEINHAGIRNKVSANAKHRAWTEIVRELKKELPLVV